MYYTSASYTTKFEMFSFLHYFFFLMVLLSFAFITEAKVPKAKAFHYLVQERELGRLVEENQVLSYGDILGISNHPFHLCIIGSNQYPKVITEMTLALRLDTRLVWEANRGKPVHENGRFSFHKDGNLVLTEANGTIVWQTNTANKGVVDLKLLPNGNMVLVDRYGRYVWQSFDHPSDTILVGQSLRPGEQNKLVSRVSPFDNRNGPYSLVMDGGRVIFYYKSKHSSKEEIYSLMESIAMSREDNILARMTLESGRVYNEPYFYYLQFNFTSSDSSYYSVTPPGMQLKFNTTYSFLRLGQDGNLRIYTYFNKVRQTYVTSSWDETFAMFSSKLYYESECQLPEKCGKFGVCEDNQCVACPTPNGLMGWSRKCSTPKLPSCNKQSRTNVDYYRINGIDHFSSNFSGEGPMIFGKCKEKCSNDCKCLGFFYRKETSKCLITSQLNTLTRVSNPSHLAFIKVAK